jgi:chemotaxis protein methyltransferase CheR
MSFAAKNLLTPDPTGHESLAKDVKGFHLLTILLKEISGINLPETDKNIALVASRIYKVLKKNNLASYKALHHAIKAGNEALKVSFVEALTTNKTEFFRESAHFDLLKKFLPQILDENLDAGRRELRVWCAAASTGQETYTLAMTLRESIADLTQWNVRFLASDIDTQCLAKCQTAIYTKSEMADVSRDQISRYFSVSTKDGKETYAVRNELKNMIKFSKINLMEHPFPFQHKFDVVFCRNVLIYFDRETQGQVVNELVKSLRVGGLLFIGHTESGVPKPVNVETVAVAVYRKTKA